MAIRENLDQWALVPFESQAHLTAAMRDAQYRDPYNSAYRDAVAAKVLISTNTGTNSVQSYDGTVRTDADPNAGMGNIGTEAMAQRQQEEQDAERALLERYGSLALSPAKQYRLNTATER